jgi:hypothetical protein
MKNRHFRGKWISISVALIGLLFVAPVIAENVSATSYYWSPFNNCYAYINTQKAGSYSSTNSYIETPTFSTSTGVATMKMYLEGVTGASGHFTSSIDVRGNTFTATSTTQTVTYVWYLQATGEIRSYDTNSYTKLQVWGRLFKSDGTQFATTQTGSWTITSTSNGNCVSSSLNTFYSLPIQYSGLVVGQTYTLDTVLYGVIHVSTTTGMPYGHLNVHLAGSTALY